MKDTITIPLETYKCLREHLQKANELFNSLGLGGDTRNSITPNIPKQTKRITNADKLKNYRNLIESGGRGGKNIHKKK